MEPGINIKPGVEKSLDSFLEFLSGRDIISPAELSMFKSIMNTRRMFGIIALRESFISPNQLQEILERLNNGDGEERIGQIMVREKLMTEEQVQRVLDIQNHSGDLPPDIILDTGILPREILEEELKKFLDS